MAIGTILIIWTVFLNRNFSKLFTKRFSLFTWRSIFCVLGGLLLSDLGQVPDVKAAVGAGRGQDRLVVGRPLDLLAEAKKKIFILNFTF